MSDESWGRKRECYIVYSFENRIYIFGDVIMVFRYYLYELGKCLFRNN